MCGLSLAWVTSENSTMLLESDSSWLTLAGPYPMLPRLSAPVSGVDCPCPCSTPTLCCLPLCCPAANSRLLGRVVNSHSRPRTTSGYGEISCPRILCLVSRQNRQLNRLLWQPNHIVLHHFWLLVIFFVVFLLVFMLLLLLLSVLSVFLCSF